MSTDSGQAKRAASFASASSIRRGGTDAREAFDPRCERCPRLAGFLSELRARHPTYHNRPVPPFGDAAARLLVVGLAPGKHGANASGRPFTGDHAGLLLYRTLHALGLATAAESQGIHDGLQLLRCRITNAVKCLPPENKPLGSEVEACNGFLAAELSALPAGAVVLALGAIAHRACVKALGLRQNAYPFGHGREHALPGGGWLIDSYHCSRYNTQTGRLTSAMFEAVLARATQRACNDDEAI